MLLDDSDRIKILNDILPLVKNYRNLIFVIKYGGSAMQDISFIDSVVKDIVLLFSLGIKPIVVHGGGPLINHWLKKLNINPKFDNGLRVTDSMSMEVVEMVLSGQISKYLVSVFNLNGVNAVSLSGKDANLIRCIPLFPNSNNFTGEVNFIEPDILHILLANNYIPIISSVSCDDKGNTYNINADSVASAIASAMKAEKLFLLTDTPGVLSNLDNSASVIKILTTSQIEILKENKIIVGGMFPKVNACINALSSGVESSYILDGRFKHSLLYSLFTDTQFGTKIIND